MANRTKRTPKKEEKFLETLRLSGNVSAACKAISLRRATAYEWREQSKDFAALWDEAVETGYDLLEQEARRRAHDGLVKKKFHKNGTPLIDPETGKQYYEREYSDTLLIFLLKGGRPEKYRERTQTELTGPGGAMPALNIYINGLPSASASGSGVSEPSK